MLILCREADKYQGRETVCYIVSRNVTDRDLQFLSLRSRLNPELQYYATRLDERMTEDEVLALFKTRKFLKEPEFVKL